MSRGIGAGSSYKYEYDTPDGYGESQGGFGPRGVAPAPAPAADVFTLATYHWPMDEASGDRANIISGPTPALGETAGQISGVTGKVADAARIDNAANTLRADVNALGNLYTTGFSVTFWFEVANPLLHSRNRLTIWDSADLASLLGFDYLKVVGVTEEFVVDVQDGAGGSGGGIYLTDPGLAAGWHHVGIVFQGAPTNLCYAYIDGVIRPETTSMTDPVTNPPLAHHMIVSTAAAGGQTGGGDFDQIVIWNYPLAQDDILSIYNGGAGRPPA